MSFWLAMVFASLNSWICFRGGACRANVGGGRRKGASTRKKRLWNEGSKTSSGKGEMGVSKGATRKFAESGSALLGLRRAGSRTMTRSEVLFCDRGHFSRSYSTILLRTKTKVQRDPRSWGPQSIFGDLNSQSKSAKRGIGAASLG